MVKTLPFQGRGHGFDPWFGKFGMLLSVTKKPKTSKYKNLMYTDTFYVKESWFLLGHH